MPFDPCDSLCQGTDSNTYSSVNEGNVADGSPYANMGYVGFVNLRIDSLAADNILRVTAANINLKQEVTMPDVIDGRIDRTVYQLGPKIVEGTLSFPLIADEPSALVASKPCPTPSDLSVTGSLLNSIWCWTTSRGPQGRLTHSDAILDVRYANHAAFRFDTAIVNTMSMAANAGDPITMDVAVIGRGRTPVIDPENSAGQNPRINIKDFLAPARVLTWNDITVNGVQGCQDYKDLFYSNQVRSYNLEINNHADRYYTFNGSLLPVDVNVAKREITGSIKLLGYQNNLRILTDGVNGIGGNQSRFTEKNEIRMAFYIGAETFSGGAFTNRDWTGNTSAPQNSSAIFYRKLTGTVFMIEEVSLTNAALETTVNFVCLGNDQADYQSFLPSTSCSYPAWQ